jgi:hypothetical protein
MFSWISTFLGERVSPCDSAGTFCEHLDGGERCKPTWNERYNQRHCTSVVLVCRVQKYVSFDIPRRVKAFRAPRKVAHEACFAVW